MGQTTAPQTQFTNEPVASLSMLKEHISGHVLINLTERRMTNNIEVVVIFFVREETQVRGLIPQGHEHNKMTVVILRRVLL